MPGNQSCPKCSATVPAGSAFCQQCGSNVRNQKATGASPVLKLAIGVLAIVLVVGAAITGISMSRSKSTAQAPTGEIKGAGQLPDWLASADPAIIADYAWAAENLDVLDYMPCYCGCGNVGHMANSACYFTRGKDGKIRGYDAHAVG